MGLILKNWLLFSHTNKHTVILFCVNCTTNNYDYKTPWADSGQKTLAINHFVGTLWLEFVAAVVVGQACSVFQQEPKFWLSRKEIVG